MKLRTLLSVVVAIAFMASLAGAGPITGSSTGTLTIACPGILCDSPSASVVRWKKDVNGTSWSTLTAVPVSFFQAVPPSANDLGLAELVWADLDNSTNNNPGFDATWTLSLVFTDPVTNTSDVLTLDIATQNGNGTDTIRLEDISGWSFALPGFTVSDLKFVRTGDGSLSHNGDGTWDWTATKDHPNSTLWLTADFSAAGTSTIPEPGSLILLGSGLIGAAGFIRRKIAR